ncbi:MAG: right-handed parallel beta-helix repeat-containing protein [Gammaproteobacteria bacterium]
MNYAQSDIRGGNKPGYRDDAAERETGANGWGTNVTRWLCYLACGLGVSLAAPAASAYPVAFYSDLDSGPVGSYVTVWGKGFGGTAGVVKLGSTAATDILSWSDTKVEFRVPAGFANSITVHDTVGHVSNPLPFTVRLGRIFFVSPTGSNTNDGLAASPQASGVGPWKDLSKVVGWLTPGDIAYVRNGTYTAILNSTRRTTFYIQSANSGSTGLPKALVAYPGEYPVIGSGSNSTGVYMRENVRDWTIAKLNFKASSAAIHMSGSGNMRMRLVGNEAGGIPSTYGTIGLKGCTDCKILGNHVYNSGKPGNKLAHLIYYGGYGLGANVEIAWNLLHDEKGGRGIQIYGHTDADRLSALSIHDNIVYNCPYDGILVGQSDAAYKPWISDAAVYNNIVYNSGGGIRINNTGVAAKVLHNTLHKNSTSLKLENAKSAEVRNNILSLPTSNQVTIALAGTLTLSHNGYHGTQAAPSQDTNPTKGDPLFTNASAGDFSLKPQSPFMNKGKVLSPALPKVSVPADSAPDLGEVQWKVGTVPY